MRAGTLSRRRDGISALFDALVFFVILLVASGALSMAVSSASSAAAQAESTRDLGRFVSEVHASALSCTVGPLNISSNGTDARIPMITVMECILTMLEMGIEGAPCDPANASAAVLSTYSLLVDGRYHFAVQAEMDGHGSLLFLSDTAGSPSGIGKVRWTCAVPFALRDVEGTLTLFLWR